MWTVRFLRVSVTFFRFTPWQYQLMTTDQLNWLTTENEKTNTVNEKES